MVNFFGKHHAPAKKDEKKTRAQIERSFLKSFDTVYADQNMTGMGSIDSEFKDQILQKVDLHNVPAQPVVPEELPEVKPPPVEHPSLMEEPRPSLARDSSKSVPSNPAHDHFVKLFDHVPTSTQVGYGGQASVSGEVDFSKISDKIVYPEKDLPEIKPRPVEQPSLMDAPILSRDSSRSLSSSPAHDNFVKIFDRVPSATMESYGGQASISDEVQFTKLAEAATAAEAAAAAERDAAGEAVTAEEQPKEVAKPKEYVPSNLKRTSATQQEMVDPFKQVADTAVIQ